MQDLQQTIAQFLDYIRGMWLKKRYIIISSWLICPIGFFYVSTLPDLYESKAVVYVDTRSVMESLLEGLTVGGSPTEKIEIMTKTLLSRSNLEEIARQADLDLTTDSEKSFNSLIIELSKEIKLSGTSRDNIFSIVYQNESPLVAQKVVQETLDIMIEGTLGNNRQESDAADRFLENQISDYEDRLIASESRLANFKRKYNDLLPVAGTFYTQLQGLKSVLEEDRLIIAQLKEKISALRSRIGKPKSSDEVSAVDDITLKTRYDERISSLEGELDRLMLRFTDQHPDVIETKALLSRLENLRDKKVKEFLDSYDGSDKTSFNELNQEVQLELSRLEGELASTKIKEELTLSKISELESKVDLIPQIEAELTALNRDYDVTKTKYFELLNRKETADLSRRAEVSSEDLKFRVVEPPTLPLTPTNSKRILLLAGVLILGFGSGSAVALLLSQISPMLFRYQQLQVNFPYPVIGVVTHLDKDAIVKRNRKKVMIFLLSSSLLFITFLALLIIDVFQIDILGAIRQ